MDIWSDFKNRSTQKKIFNENLSLVLIETLDISFMTTDMSVCVKIFMLVINECAKTYKSAVLYHCYRQL